MSGQFTRDDGSPRTSNTLPQPRYDPTNIARTPDPPSGHFEIGPKSTDFMRFFVDLCQTAQERRRTLRDAGAVWEYTFGSTACVRSSRTGAFRRGWAIWFSHSRSRPGHGDPSQTTRHVVRTQTTGGGRRDGAGVAQSGIDLFHTDGEYSFSRAEDASDSPLSCFPRAPTLPRRRGARQRRRPPSLKNRAKHVVFHWHVLAKTAWTAGDLP